MGKYKYSIIVAVYNIEQYLELCINSLINQKYEDFQLILVDDGSSDRSGDICNDFSSIYKNINVIHQKNQGLSMARNNGLIAAEGEYILFVDGDDFVTDDYLYVINRELTDDIDMLIFDFSIVDEKHLKLTDKYREQRIKSGEFDNKQMLDLLFSQKIMAYAWNKVYRRSLFTNTKFPENRRYEDIATTYKLVYTARKIKVIDAKLYNYLATRKDSITNSRTEKDCLDIYNTMHEIESFIDKENFNTKCLNQYMCTLYLALRLSLSVTASNDTIDMNEIYKQFLFYYKRAKFSLCTKNPYKYKIFLYRYGLLNSILKMKRKF
ncbi:glycosyltransferase [Amedibacillus sp. YH-ame10]